VREIAEMEIVPLIQCRGASSPSAPPLRRWCRAPAGQSAARSRSSALDLDLALFCISLARRTRRDFFLPLLKDAPVEVVTAEDKALKDYLASRKRHLLRT